MKTKIWLSVFAGILLLCMGLSLIFFLPQEKAQKAEIWSDGKLLETVDLSVDRQWEVESANGTNVITVHDGAIAVTHADCPDGYCMQRGFCDRGAQIVCLPNRLVIRFVGEQSVDGVAG